MKTPLSLAAASVAVLALAGCSTTAGQAADDGKLTVIASTNVYADIAEAIGGDRIDVTAIIDSATKDPHSYEASARDRLSVQGADLIIENGGGYDSFIEELREGSDAAVVTAVEFSHDFPGAESHSDEGHDEHAEDEHAHGEEEHAEDEHGHEGHDHIEGFNEHIWFDVHTMIHVVEQIAVELAEIDPEGEADFTANAEKLNAELESIENELDILHEQLEGTPVFLTEPLPGYLAAAAGLDDVTPEGFASAVEEGNDVAPATLLDALALIEDGKVTAVLANAQTGGTETDRVEAAAETAGIPVVGFTELLQPDQSYAEWMRAAIDDLAAALQQ